MKQRDEGGVVLFLLFWSEFYSWQSYAVWKNTHWFLQLWYQNFDQMPEDCDFTIYFNTDSQYNSNKRP